MGKNAEPLDSLTGRISTGIHLVAMATIVSPGSTREELDLAALILKRDPKRSAPRENGSAIEEFNRLLDVPIESANDSAGCGTRAERRARLAGDLGRKGLVLMDSAALAELLAAKLELEQLKFGTVLDFPAPIEMLEAADDEPRSYQPSASFSAEEDLEELACVPSSAREPLYYLEHNPGAIAPDERGELNPSVND
jgi:hypothetical protein